LLVPVLAQCQDTHEGSRKASVIDNEVWLDSVTGPPQLTQDSVPKWFALLALDGKRIVYLEEEFSSHVQQNQSPQVIMVDDNGKELWRVTPGGSWPGDRFDMLEWIDDQRIGTMHCGHANCIYWVLDAGSGKTLDVMKGGFDFVWSHDRKWVARRIVDCCDTEELPGDVVGSPVDEAVMLNKKDVYPPLVSRQQVHQTERSQRHSLGPFTWSPNDVWLGFTDTISPEGDPYVMLVSPTGAILREPCRSIFNTMTSYETSRTSIEMTTTICTCRPAVACFDSSLTALDFTRLQILK
jgi:hypothetical protein